MSKAQISMWEEKIVDSFAGGGGASTGIELATGRVVDIAINHDPDAILMHKTNHPHTVHYQASVWDVDPLEVTGGSPVGLLWASPDCKHFSKAKGGNPGEIRPFRPAATPAQYHAPGGQRRGQVRDQIRCPVYRTNGLRGAERTGPTSSQYRRPSAHGGGERQAWSLRPGHGAMDGDKHNQLHGAPRQ